MKQEEETGCDDQIKHHKNVQTAPLLFPTATLFFKQNSLCAAKPHRHKSSSFYGMMWPFQLRLLWSKVIVLPYNPTP